MELPTRSDVYNGIDDFYNAYEFEDETLEDQMRTLVKITYYALTTLSTIGFGDISPRSTKEKFIWAFVLLWGVTALTIVINKLMDMVIEERNIYR